VEATTDEAVAYAGEPFRPVRAWLERNVMPGVELEEASWALSHSLHCCMKCVKPPPSFW
jgi:hypothetical protein